MNPRVALRLHPSCSLSEVATVVAEAFRPSAEVLELRFAASGRMRELIIPAPAVPKRTDGLWRSTCFEAFVRREDGGYLEFNLSPSGQWAAYSFTGYRQGIAPLEIDPPAIETLRRPHSLELRARIGPLACPEPWRLGLSAVIAEADGGTGYWALAHPPGKPDFHHPDCFDLELPAPGRA
jgi:hypothetical protein